MCQGLSTVLNVTFIATLRRAFPADKDRASFMGMFYALANLASGVFQFGVIPHVMQVRSEFHGRSSFKHCSNVTNTSFFSLRSCSGPPGCGCPCRPSWYVCARGSC